MMSLTKLAALVGLVLTASACARFDPVTRNLPLSALHPNAANVQVLPRDYHLVDLQVDVPAELRVSEGNGYYPLTDIVWRGDPVGNRHIQIAAMFETAGDRVATKLSSGRPVLAAVEVERFHGVTERTRFTVGGVYHIVFNFGIFDAETGEEIEPVRRVAQSLSAPGGVAAIMADHRGQTEKVRVTDFLTVVLMDELTGQQQL